MGVQEVVLKSSGVPPPQSQGRVGIHLPMPHPEVQVLKHPFGDSPFPGTGCLPGPPAFQKGLRATLAHGCPHT